MHFLMKMLVFSRNKINFNNGYMYSFSQFSKFAQKWLISLYYEIKWSGRCKSYNKIHEYIPRRKKTTVKPCCTGNTIFLKIYFNY